MCCGSTMIKHICSTPCQLSSSHSASHLGASAPSIPEIVGSQVTPLSSASPEGKKIQQDICNVSQRGEPCQVAHVFSRSCGPRRTALCMCPFV